jgi:hypothetical protein
MGSKKGGDREFLLKHGRELSCGLYWLVILKNIMRLNFPLLLSATLLVSSISSVTAADNKAGLANLNKVTSYGGMNFGSKFPAWNFQIEQDRGDLKIYRKIKQNHLMGPVHLDEILYYAFQGKFYGVVFHTDDGENSALLLTILIDAFGTGKKEAHGGTTRNWSGNNIGLIFDENNSTGQANAFLFDERLHEACLTYQESAAQAAAQSLIQGK